MIYSVRQISDIVRPIAEKYGLKAVYLFGSYRNIKTARALGYRIEILR